VWRAARGARSLGLRDLGRFSDLVVAALRLEVDCCCCLLLLLLLLLGLAGQAGGVWEGGRDGWEEAVKGRERRSVRGEGRGGPVRVESSPLAQKLAMSAVWLQYGIAPHFEGAPYEGGGRPRLRYLWGVGARRV
jgi:hypothetical protein